MKNNEQKKKRNRERKKQKKRSRKATVPLLKRRHPRRLWESRRRNRRKKDSILGMPFIIAFHGDPAQTFYCADHPTSFELIPRTNKYNEQFGRLKRYMWHHVTCMHKRVLIYKAGKWNLRRRFMAAYSFLTLALGISIYKFVESLFKNNGFGVFVFILMVTACVLMWFLLKVRLKY